MVNEGALWQAANNHVSVIKLNDWFSGSMSARADYQDVPVR